MLSLTRRDGCIPAIPQMYHPLFCTPASRKVPINCGGFRFGRPNFHPHFLFLKGLCLIEVYTLRSFAAAFAGATWLKDLEPEVRLLFNLVRLGASLPERCYSIMKAALKFFEKVVTAL
jgi:hypothetical protein